MGVVMVTKDVACARLAARQEGVLHREQARRAGLSDRQIQWRVRTGRWERVHPGVYRQAGAPRTWWSAVQALVLWLGPDCVLSHRTAAQLHGFPRYEDARALDLTVFRRVRQPTGIRAHRTTHLGTREVTVVSGLRVTSVERTLLDLSATEATHHVQACFHHALSRKLTTLDRLETFLLRHAGHAGVALLKVLVHHASGRGGPCESELESRVLELLEAEGLPQPVLQQRVSAGGKTRRLDFRFPGTRVVLEADGYAYHSGVDAFERDRMRANALTLKGYRVLQWTWKAMQDHPDRLLDQLRAMLEVETERRAA
jgi:very-short-patch-repair endonuclease